jgi:hypothetical protein
LREVPIHPNQVCAGALDSAFASPAGAIDADANWTQMSGMNLMLSLNGIQRSASFKLYCITD